MRQAILFFRSTVLFCSVLLGYLHASEFQDQWAEALILASNNSSVKAKKAEEVFLKALQKADQKALIYVSLGDYYAGPVALRLLSDRIQADDDTALGDMTESQSKALQCYVAAVKDDPACTVAWFRILRAPQANEGIKEKALANLLLLEPENGLPHYLGAYVHMQQKNVMAALISLQKGNKKPFSIPCSPVPEKSSITYPDEPEYKAAGLVGQPIPVGVLEGHVRSTELFITLGLRSYLRGLARQIVKEGIRQQTQGKEKEAIEYFRAAFNLGLKLIQSDAKNGVDILVGFAIVEIASKDLRSLYTGAGNVAMVKRLDEYQSSQKTFNKEYREFLNASKEQLSKLSEMEQLIKGEEMNKVEKKFLTDLLEKTGLNVFKLEE